MLDHNMFLIELLLASLHSAGLAAAHRECQGPDQLSPGQHYTRDINSWHKARDYRSRATPQ
eukprot:1157399-Pelagomonas_calceolata.AAC.2